MMFGSTRRYAPARRQRRRKFRRHGWRKAALLEYAKLGSLAMLFATRRASSSEIFLVRRGTGELVMTFWLVASA